MPAPCGCGSSAGGQRAASGPLPLREYSKLRRRPGGPRGPQDAKLGLGAAALQTFWSPLLPTCHVQRLNIGHSRTIKPFQGKLSPNPRADRTVRSIYVHQRPAKAEKTGDSIEMKLRRLTI
jgi:hypothetical protein